jgi:AmmeMemoRadiSam system protein A
MNKVDPNHKGDVLLEIAREAVRQAALGLDDDPPWDEPWLHETGATFVTLRKDGDLRGCLGTLIARRPLLEDVRSNARAVVCRDPRFPPVKPQELPELAVEVSLLSPLVEVRCGSEAEVLHELNMNQDGWVLEYGSASGTSLPQVWEMLPRPRDFWHRLKQKAGLEADFWDPKMKLWRYSVSKWAWDP